MPKVLCTLQNASDEINGVKFTEHAKGKLSEEISNEQAEQFASIPGYSLVGAAASAAPVAADDARDALEARAEAVGLKVKGNWGIERLTTEVEAAEAAAAAPVAAETTAE